MVAPVVPQLVGEHGLHLARREAREQRVEEYDSLRGAEAREIGVAVRRALRAVHHVEAVRAEAAAREQRLDSILERRVRERREPVEEGRDERRVDHQDGEVERHPGDPHVQPPMLAHRLHQPQHEQDERHPERKTERGLARQIGDEQRRRHAVEAEPRLDHERAVDRQRQFEHREQQGDGDHQRHAVPQPSGVKQLRPRVRDRLQEPSQRECEQHHGAEQQIGNAEARACATVVSRLLMRGERDRLGEPDGQRTPVAPRSAARNAQVNAFPMA